jgi:hypothetical protein
MLAPTRLCRESQRKKPMRSRFTPMHANETRAEIRNCGYVVCNSHAWFVVSRSSFLQFLSRFVPLCSHCDRNHQPVPFSIGVVFTTPSFFQSSLHSCSINSQSVSSNSEQAHKPSFPPTTKKIGSQQNIVLFPIQFLP